MTTRREEAELLKIISESKKLEQEFFNRHNIGNEGLISGYATPARRAWAQATEIEYKSKDSIGRVFLEVLHAKP